MQDVMLDLETMGTGPNAAIIAIGAVEFDVKSGELGREFYNTVSLQSAVESGGAIDASTVIWWMDQSDAARAEFKRTGIHITDALVNFSTWLGGCGLTSSRRVWGNGAAFDNVILASAYRASGFDVPWEFWNDRCYRTIRAILPPMPIERGGTHHRAVDDARTQARHLIQLLRGVNLQ